MSGFGMGGIYLGFLKVGAAPHPPAGTFSPYRDGEKGEAATLAPPSPRSSRGEGKGEGQRRPLKTITARPAR
ncbi:hypothetical protein FKO01_02530 [Mesorhizobium sp. B2-3-3]|nr:hypothetical protein FKO01_02530 [Mesorhizobium sp. B2-3-3]